MLDHHLQRSIVYRLALSHDLHFSELKPDTIDNKLFTYHLQKVVSAGFVAKNEQGLYSLTPEGRRLGIRVLANQQAFIDQPESVLFLVVRRKGDGAWLLYKRKTHPLIDKVGFMHCTPNATEETVQTAQKECQEKTGLNCQFSVLGGGFFKVYKGDDLESFTHFSLLVCEDAQGELKADDEYAEYFWESEPDFTDDSMLPNMATLADLYQHGELFFVEKLLRV